MPRTSSELAAGLPIAGQTGTLDDVQLKGLEDKLAALEQTKGTQIAILMVPTTQPEDIASYANRVGNAWKIGRKAVGDGVLVVVAKNDRKIRIERQAYGDQSPARLDGLIAAAANALESNDPKADHAELTAAGVDVDAELMGGDGTVPLLFFFRDHDGNHLMIVETQAGRESAG